MCLCTAEYLFRGVLYSYIGVIWFVSLRRSLLWAAHGTRKRWWGQKLPGCVVLCVYMWDLKLCGCGMLSVPELCDETALVFFCRLQKRQERVCGVVGTCVCLCNVEHVVLARVATVILVLGGVFYCDESSMLSHAIRQQLLFSAGAAWWTLRLVVQCYLCVRYCGRFLHMVLQV